MKVFLGLFLVLWFSSPLPSLAYDDASALDFSNPFLTVDLDQEGVMALYEQISNGNLDLVKSFIQGNGNINIRDQYQRTPLMIAAEFRQVAILKLLIKHKADLNAVSDLGRTALYKVAKAGYAEELNLLIDAKADMNIAIDGHWTPLMASINLKQHHASTILINRGADLSKTDWLERTALHHAVGIDQVRKNDFPVIAHKLVLAGANINARNIDGLTPLHMAVKFQNLKSIARLIQLNADTDIQDNQGWTPLISAVSMNHKEIVEHLINGGADIHKITPLYCNALMIAEDSGYEHLATLLKRFGAKRVMNKENVDCKTPDSDIELVIKTDSIPLLLGQLT